MEIDLEIILSSWVPGDFGTHQLDICTYASLKDSVHNISLTTTNIYPNLRSDILHTAKTSDDIRQNR